MLSIETLAPVALNSRFDMLLDSHGTGSCSVSEIQRQQMSVPLLTCIANRISGLLKSPMSSTSMTWRRKHASQPLDSEGTACRHNASSKHTNMQAPGSNSRVVLGDKK